MSAALLLAIARHDLDRRKDVLRLEASRKTPWQAVSPTGLLPGSKSRHSHEHPCLIHFLIE
jgi:hypothetical protein